MTTEDIKKTESTNMETMTEDARLPWNHVQAGLLGLLQQADGKRV